MSWISDIARPDIVALKPYEHASWEPHLERLHANELPWRADADESEAGLNRYPEPQPRELVAKLTALYGAAPGQVLIDLLERHDVRIEHRQHARHVGKRVQHAALDVVAGHADPRGEGPDRCAA